MLRPSASLLAVAVALGSGAAACNPPIDVGGPCAPWRAEHGLGATGENPCREQLYFPSGVAVDPTGDVLYVSNANADLRYNGGTVAAVDLARVECAIAFQRAGGQGALPAIPACAGLDESFLRALAPSTSHYNGCVDDPLDPSISECDEGAFIVDAVRIGNFGGQLVVQQRPTGTVEFPVVESSCGGAGVDGGAQPSGADGGSAACVATSTWSRRLWLPVRGDPSVTYVNVRKGAFAMNPHAPGAPATLDCTDPSNGDPANVPNACSSQRVTVRDFHSNMPGAPKPATPIPAEPFGVTLDEGLLTDGKTPYSRLVVTHLSSGEVTLINSGAFYPSSTADLPTPSERVVLDVRGGFFPLDTSMRAGTYATAPRVAGSPTSEWYVTSRLNPSIAAFRVADVGVLLPTVGFNVAGIFNGGGDIRELAFTPDGSRGFFVEDFPPSLFTVDTRPDATQGGTPRNLVVDAVTVCQGASRLGLRQWQEPAPSGGTRTATRAYVVCFTTGQMLAVDPDLGLVTAVINVGNGANDVAFNFGNGGVEPVHRRAYVTDYGDNTVSVIDLDPGSPTENRVIFRIGLPQPPVTM